MHPTITALGLAEHPRSTKKARARAIPFYWPRILFPSSRFQSVLLSHMLDLVISRQPLQQRSRVASASSRSQSPAHIVRPISALTVPSFPWLLLRPGRCGDDQNLLACRPQGGHEEGSSCKTSLQTAIHFEAQQQGVFFGVAGRRPQWKCVQKSGD